MKSYKTFSFPRDYTCLLTTLASLVPQMVKNPPAMQDTWVQYLGPIPGSGRSLREGNGYALQYSCLENPMDRGAWWATVHGVKRSQT